MGFDVTYHPVSEAQLRRWYFDLLDDASPKASLVAEYGIDPLFSQKLDELIENGREVEPGAEFDSSLGFSAAVVAGIFARYHYVRGCMLSEVPGIASYTRGWAEIAPAHVAGMQVADRIACNYSSGVFVAPEHVARLRADIETKPEVRAAVFRVFEGPHIAILQTALDEAAAAGHGLLEATDVIEPNPLDLNATAGWSNRLNCDPAGAMLYADTAYRQLEALGADAALKRGEVQRVTIDPNSNEPLAVERDDVATDARSATPIPPNTAPPTATKKRRWFGR